MLSAFVKAAEQLGDVRVRRPLWISLSAAVAVFALLWLGAGYVIRHTAFFSIGWLDTVTDLLGGLAVVVMSWMLFPAVVGVALGLLLEDVALAVEARHFRRLPRVEGLGLADSVLISLRFLGALVAGNLVVLLFLLVPPLFPFVFYAVNGYLLGREYFELVALRRIGAVEARALRRTQAGRLFVAGLVIAFLLTVPVVNLVAPVVATAAMVHLFEAMRRAGGN